MNNLTRVPLQQYTNKLTLVANQQHIFFLLFLFYTYVVSVLFCFFIEQCIRYCPVFTALTILQIRVFASQMFSRQGWGLLGGSMQHQHRIPQRNVSTRVLLARVRQWDTEKLQIWSWSFTDCSFHETTSTMIHKLAADSSAFFLRGEREETQREIVLRLPQLQ